MRVLWALIGGAALVAGCSAKPDEEPAAPVSGGTEVVSAVPAASASTEPPVARSESVSNDLYEFEYFYPVQAAAIPDLRAWLDDDLERQRRELIENAQQQLAESKKNDFPFNPLGNWVAWQVVTDLPGWLSLSASVSTYQGGAHPNHGFASLIWDRQANVRRKAIDLFTSKEALSRALRRDFCRAIDKQREAKRGEPVRPGRDDPFSECLDPTDSTIILGSSNGKAFDRIGILVAPYEAGPYAEGDYEVTLPVSDAVMAAVKPGYRPTFVKAR